VRGKSAAVGQERARPGGRVWLAAFLATVVTVTSASGQVPDSIPQVPPPVAIPGDTIEVPIPPDEVEGDTIPDALQRAAEQAVNVPDFPDFPTPSGFGWSSATWSWGREELALLPALTLLDFVERLPGMVVFRAGGFGRPDAITAAGMGGGRLRVRIDGYELDPYDAAAYPLSAVSLVDISRITIERGLTEIRIDVESFRLDGPEPYSIVQVGTGPQDNRLLRAMFSRGLGQRSVGTGAFDLVQTGGIGVREDYATRNINFRWATMPTDATGLQLEFRSTTIDRSGTEFPLESTRSDLVLRGRAAGGERLTLEALIGATRVDDDIAFDDGDDEEEPRDGRSRRDLQGLVRAAYATGAVNLSSGIRIRFGGDDPPVSAPLEFESRAVYRPLSSIRLEASGTIESSETASGSVVKVTGAYNPHPVLTLFGSGEVGTRVHTLRYLPAVDGATEEDLVFQPGSADAGSLRAGLEVAGGQGKAGVAVYDAAATEVSAFGLPFDLTVAPFAAGGLRAVEAYFDVPVFPGRDALRVDGWYTRSVGGADRSYAPADLGRFGMSFHDVYIGGQFEPFARLELVRRGPAIVPLDTDPDTRLPIALTLNLDLRIRILDVEAFLIWDNMTGEATALPVPNPPIPQPRIIYGASWRFRN
jgi:hypothetical protein